MQIIKLVVATAFFFFSFNLAAQKTQPKAFFYNGSEKIALQAKSDAAFISFRKETSSKDVDDIIRQQKGIVKTDVLAAAHGVWVQLEEGLDVATLRDNLRNQAAVVNVSPAFEVDGSRHLVGTSLVFKAKSADGGAQLLKQFSRQLMGVETVALGKTALVFVEVKPWEDPLSISRDIYETGLVDYAMPDFIKGMKADIVPNDSLFSQQWYLKQDSGADIDADSAWNVTRGLASVVVAVIDGNGYDLAHSDFQGKLFAPYDAVGNDSIPGLENESANHGTPCAGLVAAATNNREGVAGVGYNTKVMPILIGFGASGGGFNTSLRVLSNAAQHILQQSQVVAVSMSYGGPTTLAEQDVYQSMTTGRGDKGIALFASAGNSSSTSFRYPAAFPFVTAIGASNRFDQLASFSNYGSKLSIVSPGENILALDNQGFAGYASGDYYDDFGGTSAACPITAGVAGLVAAVDTNLTAQQIINTVLSTADKVGNVTYANDPTHPLSTWNNRMGYGRLNAYKAVLKAGDKRTAKPNLVARSVVFSMDSSVLNYRMVIVNNGTAATTTAATLNYYLSIDQAIATNDTLLGTRTLPILGIGDSVAVTFSANACSPTRVSRGYYSGFLIDANNQVAEISESDNDWVTPQDFYLSCLANAPNLTRLTDTLAIVGDTVAKFQMRLINNGNLAASVFKVHFYASADSIIRPSDILLGDTTLSGLGVGGTIDVAFARYACDFLPQTGRYYLGYIIDPLNLIAEKNESDNRFVSPNAFNFRCIATGCTEGGIYTACTGSLSDGSSGGSYLGGLSCNWLIRPTGAASVALTFTNFETEYQNDVVTVYDGVNANAPIIGQFSGSFLPPSVVGNSGSLFITFTTTQNNHFAGWSANYSCRNTRSYAVSTYNTSGGTVTGGGIYNEGQTGIFVARPDAGYRVSRWTDENYNLLGLSDTLRFIVNSNRILYVYFEQIPTCSGQTTFTNCSGTFEDGSGAGQYSDNANCSWLIRPNSSNARSIVLKFAELKTEFYYDYVNIYDGVSASAPLLGTFSGSELPTDSIIANSGAAFITFRTDVSEVDQGWRLTYSCDSIKRYTVRISISPNPQAGTVTGGGVYTEGSVARLTARANPLYEFTGWYNTRTGQTLSTTDSLSIDMYESYNLIAVFRLRPTCSGLTTLTDCEGSFDDGSGAANYAPDGNCAWLIAPNSNPSSLILRFTAFQTNDYVSIYDGTSANAPFLGSYYGSTLPSDSIVANSGTAYVVFRTYNSGAGWRLNYRCDSVRRFTVRIQSNSPAAAGTTTGAGLYTEGASVTLIAKPNPTYMFVNWTDQRTGQSLSTSDTFRFVIDANYLVYANFAVRPTCTGTTTFTDCVGSFEDGSGAGNYAPYMNCSWLIQPNNSSSRSIVLKFSEFQTTGSDYVSIYDGTSINAPFLGTFRGSILPTDSVIANSGSAFVVFTSYNTGRGWRLNYRCDSIKRYIVKTTVYPSALMGTATGTGTYTEGATVTMVAKPNTGYIFVNWQDQRTGQIVSTEDSLRFNIMEHRYWQANFRVRPTCSGLTTLTDCSGSFDDGSGSANYTEGLNCSWLIQPSNSSTRSIVLKFSDFQTYFYDYVRIYDGTSTNAPLLGTFNGNTVPRDSVIANSGSAFVVFTTSYVGRGWRLNYRCDSVRRYFVSAMASPSIGGTTTGTGTYTEGATVTMVAKPSAAYIFQNWQDQRTGQIVSTTDSLRFTINAHRYWQANFILRPTCSGLTTLTDCTGSFDDGSGNASYTPNLNCSWLIQPTTGRSVVLRFSNFQTAYNDYVRIYDGNSTSGQLLGTFSGESLPTDSIIANSGTAYVTFSTYNAYAGWRLNYRCDSVRRYVVNLMTNGSAGGTVTGNGIYTEGVSVTLVARPSAAYIFQNWTDQRTGQIVSTNPTLQFTINQHRYLTANFIIRPTCSGMTTFDACTGTFDDGSGNANYSDNLDCSWLIQPPLARSIVLKFNAFQTESIDYVNIYDGTSPNAPLIGSFSGSNIPTDSIIANSGTAFVTFRTDRSVTYSGWRLTYRCDSVRRYLVNLTTNNSSGGTVSGSGVYTEGASVTLVARPLASYIFQNWTDQRTGQIVSTNATFQFTINQHRYLTANFRIRPTCSGTTTLETCTGTFDDGSGNANYTDNLDCSWLIQPSLARSIILRFNAFQTESVDYVRIYDGTSSSAPLIGSFNGSSIPTDSIIANSGTVFISFRTDGSVTYSGWRLTYRCDSVRRYLVSTTIGGYPANGGTVVGSGIYTEGAAVQLVARPIASFVFVNWTDQRTGQIVSTSDTLRFAITQNRYLTANFQPRPTCSGLTTLTDCSGSFEDGSGNANYTPNLNCSWLIQPATGRSVALKFSNFQVNYSDYVTVYDGGSESGQLLGQFSGSNIPTDSLIANSGRAFITFKTPTWTNGERGWRLNYSCDTVRRYIINARLNPNSGNVWGTVTGARAYTEGSNVVLIARPLDARYQFFNWTDPNTGQIISTADTFRFVAREHRFLYANFRLTPTCSGQNLITNCDGSFEDGSGANPYTPNLNCSWLIQPTSNPRSIIMRVSDLNISYSDNINIYDGTSESAPLLATLSGNSTSSDSLWIVANSGRAFVTFKTGSWTSGYQGWRMNYRCDTVRRYVINAAINPNTSNGLGTVTGSGLHTEGVNVMLIARPTNSTLQFLNWTNVQTGQVVSTADTLRFVASEHRSLYANFRIRPTCEGQTRLTASTASFEDGSGALNYSNSLNCSWLIQPPSNPQRIALKFNAFSLESCCDYVRVYDGMSTGGRFLGSFSGGTIPPDSLIATSGSMFILFTTDGSSTYSGWSATYRASSSTVPISTIVSGGQGGLISGGGNYEIGQLATLRATATIGWRLVRWTENNVTLSTQPTYSFTVTGARTITAEFERANYTVRVSANPANAGIVSGDGVYLAGLNVYLTANEALGYRFLNWQENNIIVGTDRNFNFVADSSRTLVANFTVSNAVQSLGDDNAVSVFPNPTSGRFTIRLQRNPTPLSINVENVLGQTVLTTTMAAGTTEQRFELLERGLYLVTLTNPQGQKATVKLTVW